ncbi:MAG: 4Fe-4S binding protein [Armatimonadota bacterium]|nr:4Fe-4S binding protein [Armatimonadota bacterium]MCX7778112.1 4Fe-4S binding protein [Armatimonadota bacterium]MDW8026173.1 4Fe-4S binding protein [Armatimonadota bacterium]
MKLDDGAQSVLQQRQQVKLKMPSLVHLTKPKRVTTIRRFVQFISLVAILYGGWLFPHAIETPLPRIKPGIPRTTLYERNRILWVSGEEAVIELYLPILACRFVAHSPLFRSCFLHCLSENLTWLTSLKVLLPHILLFLVLTLLLGRWWCGWICPLGAMQDALTWLRQKFAIASLVCQQPLRQFLFNMRHLLLWLTVAISILIAFPIFGRGGVNDSLFLVYCQICPARLIYPPFGGVNPCWYDTTNGITIFLTILGLTFFATFFVSFLIPRFWCRICAIGALLSYFNRGAFLTLEKHHKKCTSCGACRRCCPMDIERVYREKNLKVVTDPECLLCFRCVEVCPERNCLSAKIFGKTLVRSW